VIARARLRKGNTSSAKGAGKLLASSISTARAAGVTGQIMARADSACYGRGFAGTALRHRAWFSVTARMTASVKAAIASIDDDARTAIEYPQAIWEEPGQRRVSDAEVAEVPFTASPAGRRASTRTAG
jgi:hypothetical protein